MLPEPSRSIDCFMSRISGQISRKEEVFQSDYRGARYRSQLWEAGAGDTGVVNRWVLMELLTARNAQQMFHSGARSLC